MAPIRMWPPSSPRSPGENQETTGLSGLRTFRARFPEATPLLVGTGGIPVEEFLLTPPGEWA